MRKLLLLLFSALFVLSAQAEDVLRLMTYNYTDAEWDEYVAEEGGTLSYE